jgi:uncharacterized protein YecE (DUF72 family)
LCRSTSEPRGGVTHTGQACCIRRVYRSVELNASYYRWPTDAAFANWQRRLPDDFVLSVKAERGLTHGRRLFGPEERLARITRGLAHRGSGRGVLLVQLSPPAAVTMRGSRISFRACLTDFVCVEFRNAKCHQDSVFAGGTRCGVLRDERRASAVHASSDGPIRVRAVSWARSASPVRRLVHR